MFVKKIHFEGIFISVYYRSVLCILSIHGWGLAQITLSKFDLAQNSEHPQSV